MSEETSLFKPLEDVDWIGIEREYRAGASVRRIGKMFGLSHMTVHNMAKKQGWPQDLTERVRVATATKLAAAPVIPTIGSDEKAIEEAIEVASDLRADVVRQHQAQYSRLQRVAATLTQRLEMILAGEPVDLPCLSRSESPADLLRKVASVTTSISGAERTSYGLDTPAPKGEADGSTPVLDGLLKELAGRRARLEATEMQEDDEGQT
jgi:hypothetical protein